jgi:hypothetical protein
MEELIDRQYVTPEGVSTSAAYTTAPVSARNDAGQANDANDANDASERLDGSHPFWNEPKLDVRSRAFHGPLGELARYYTEDAEANPVAVLFYLLVGFGNILGRRTGFLAGSSIHHTNEHLLVVGDTASGKGDAWSEARQILAQIDPEWAGNRLCTDLSSTEGLIRMISDSSGDSVQHRGDKRLLAVLPEFSGFLKKGSRKGNTLTEGFRECWDSGCLQNNTKRSPLRVTDAHVSIIGQMTPPDMRRYFTVEDATNGFGNRALWCFLPKISFDKCVPNRCRKPDEGGEHYIRRLQYAASSALPETMQRSARADELFARYYPWLRLGIDHPIEVVNGLLARGAPHVVRLSMIYALADGSSAVLTQHVAAALVLYAYSVDSVYFLFNDMPAVDRHAAFVGHVYELIRSHPDGIGQSDLNTATGRHSKKLHGALRELASSGQITSTTVPRPGGGRGRVVWRAVSAPERESASFASLASFGGMVDRGETHVRLLERVLAGVEPEPINDEVRAYTGPFLTAVRHAEDVYDAVSGPAERMAA